MQCPMDAAASGSSPVMQFHSVADESSSHSSPLPTVLERSQRHCYGDGTPGEFPLAVSPSIVLHVLSACDLDPKDLAALEAKLAAFDMCQKRTMFKLMSQEEKERLRQRCGGSWKHVLSIYQFHSCHVLVRSLQGIKITQAAVGSRRTMLVSDMGKKKTFGKDNFRGSELVEAAKKKHITTPKIVESLKGVFVVQAAIGGYFSAVLSREGRVYTFSWGKTERLGHNSDASDVEPRLLSELEDVPVAYISAGNCYLLMLAYQPNGMSVYSIGCGLGGKLGHGCKTNKGMPKLIEQFQSLSFKPVSIAAGTWHAAALGADGRVCTWGWGHTGCLGHGDEEYKAVPTVVEGLRNVKAVHLSTGEYTTFVVADNGDVYSFGSGESLNLIFQEDDEAEEGPDFSKKNIVESLKALNKKVAQICPTNASYWLNSEMGQPHTFAVMESGELCAFGGGIRGQLKKKLLEGVEKVSDPMHVPIDLS
ncbi:hypothetical protein BAE44_0014413 [Dichanthelium oligosanthes]|uniref:Ultraviolet-B receptor UVR8 n=1 Tax=Dichanthelium oligosanthes TaxID=888268 RepID=A0A1E5VHI3_9POAL|nr:hypothetical protein BAE44_0014413 [Dichanthelium oligosanthes]